MKTGDAVERAIFIALSELSIYLISIFAPFVEFVVLSLK